MRFAVLRSRDGHWLVRDELTGLPAERYGRRLTGLTRYEAEEAVVNLDPHRLPVPIRKSFSKRA